MRNSIQLVGFVMVLALFANLALAFLGLVVMAAADRPAVLRPG
jgi:hypothetical protein